MQSQVASPAVPVNHTNIPIGAGWTTIAAPNGPANFPISADKGNVSNYSGSGSDLVIAFADGEILPAHSACRSLHRAFSSEVVFSTVSIVALCFAMFGGQVAYAQQVIANGTTQTASGTIDTSTSGPPTGYALYALNNGIITSSSPLTLIIGGNAADGAYATGGGQITIASGSTVTTTGAGGSGLFAIGTGTGGTVSTITTTDTAISTATTDFYSVYATQSGVINLTRGSVTAGSGSVGLFAFLGKATINASDVKVVTSGTNGVGVQANSDGIVNFTGGSVTTSGADGHGLYTIGAGATLKSDGTIVQTSGDSALGAFALQGQMSLNNVSIATTGSKALGAAVDNASQLTITGGSVQTAGSSASGLFSASGSLLTANAVDVRTKGNDGVGAAALFGAKLRLNGGTITTAGDLSAGLFAVGLRGTTGASLTADGVTVSTSGKKSYGGAVRGGSSLIIQNRSRITTTGAESAALYASAYDANPSTATITDSALTSQQAAGILTNGTTLNASFTGSSLSGGAALLQTINGGILNLTADSSTLTGMALTETSSGSISNVTLLNNALWTVTGNSGVTSLTNNGSTLAFAAPTSGDFKTLVVTGNYAGNGGTIVFNAALGDDNSPSDRLHVMGDTSGQTTAVVHNAGGVGAYTVNGIRLIQVDGASNGDFALRGDYVDGLGRQAVVGGAFAYTLEKNGIADPADGNWYLRSQLIPRKPVDPEKPVKPEVYQPDVPMHEAYPQVLQALNGLPTLQQRVGNRYWSGPGAGMIGGATGSLPNSAGQTAGGAFWGRIEGVRRSVDPNVSISSTSYDVDTFKLQAGLDGQLYERETARVVGGLTLHYGNASANVRSLFGDGRINTAGYGFGGTLTWYGANGFYVDGQAQTTWYDSALNSRLARHTLVSGNNGFGYAFSVETGQRIALSPSWTLTPQAQLIYSKVSFDSFTDPFDARVSLDRADSLRGGLGLALGYEQAWQAQDGSKSRSQVYGIANLYNEFGNGTRVDVAGVSFDSRNYRLWGGIGLGGSFNWNDDKFSLYGEATASTSLEDFDNSYALSGTAGLRVKF